MFDGGAAGPLAVGFTTFSGSTIFCEKASSAPDTDGAAVALSLSSVDSACFSFRFMSTCFSGFVAIMI